MHRVRLCVAAVGIALAVGVPAADAAPLSISHVSISPVQPPNAKGRAVFQLSVVLTNTGTTAASNVSVSESIFGSEITKVTHTSTIATKCGVFLFPAPGFTLARSCAIPKLGAGKSWTLTFSVTSDAAKQVSGYALAQATIAGAAVEVARFGFPPATTAPPPPPRGSWTGYWSWNAPSQMWFWTWAWISDQGGWTAS